MEKKEIKLKTSLNQKNYKDESNALWELFRTDLKPQPEKREDES